MTAPLLVAAALLLLILGKADVKLATYVAGPVGDAAVPLLHLFEAPATALRETAADARSALDLHAENERLREENRRLIAWRAEAARLALQNATLRDQLRMPPEVQDRLATTARVVGDSGGTFAHTILVDAGTAQGIRAGMAALTPAGLVGRVVEAGRRSARILLLTDLSSKIPVRIERTRERAILEGNNGPEPYLEFGPTAPAFTAHDRVLTSGEGGLLPPGLFVGEIAATREGRAFVRPAVDWERLDFVSILREAELPDPRLDGEPPGPGS